MSPRAVAKPATKRRNAGNEGRRNAGNEGRTKAASKPAVKATTKSAAKAAAKPTPPPSASPARPLRLAHRGDWRLAPENSLEALVLAAGTPGVDGVEFDVRLSRDGVPVLLHDETLERVQGRDEAVADLTAAELREAGIPSLAEVLAALPPEAFLDVEIKGPGHAKATADALRAGRGKAPERAIVSSFDEASLAAMAKALPDWPRWLNAVALDADAVELATRLGCRAIAVQWKAVTAASLKRAARRRPRGRRVDRHPATDRRAAGRARGDRRVRRRARARWLAARSAAATRGARPRGGRRPGDAPARERRPGRLARHRRPRGHPGRRPETGCAGAATRWRRSPAASGTGGSRSGAGTTSCRWACRPTPSTAWCATGRGGSTTRRRSRSTSTTAGRTGVGSSSGSRSTRTR